MYVLASDIYGVLVLAMRSDGIQLLHNVHYCCHQFICHTMQVLSTTYPLLLPNHFSFLELVPLQEKAN